MPFMAHTGSISGAAVGAEQLTVLAGVGQTGGAGVAAAMLPTKVNPTATTALRENNGIGLDPSIATSAISIYQ